MNRTASVFLVNVPELTPEANPHAPQAVRFLNPGVVAGEEERLFRPEGLPMSDAVVKAMMADFARLAKESRTAGELSAFAHSVREDFHAHTSFAAADAISAALDGQEREKRERELLAKAQTELCLAWSLEKSREELAGLQDAFGQQWSKFEQDLGLGEEESAEGEDDSLAGVMPDFVAGSQKPRACVLVDAALAFLPDGCGLYCSDASLLADWEEYGVEFAPGTAETGERFGLAGAFRQAVVPGHLLCLSRRPDPEKPWQAVEWLVIVPGGEVCR